MSPEANRTIKKKFGTVVEFILPEGPTWFVELLKEEKHFLITNQTVKVDIKSL